MTEEKPHPKKVRLDFYRLALDWVHLHTHLPRPISTPGRSSKYRDYGHPAQWASDKAAQIAGMFQSWHDLVAEERSETPPPRNCAELVSVVKAWQYLEPRFDQLVTMVEPDALQEIVDVHREVRRALGHTKTRQIMPIPCPNPDCGLLALTRTIAVGKDYIQCGSCGYTIADSYYPLLVRIALDTLIESA